MKRNTVCKMAEVLGWMELIFGSIGSIILAISIGISTAVWEDFNFGNALVVFVICVFNVLVMTVILFGIKNVLSENKDISSRLAQSCRRFFTSRLLREGSCSSKSAMAPLTKEVDMEVPVLAV